MSNATNKPKESWVFYSHSADLGGAELSMLEVIRQSILVGVSISVIMPREGQLRERLEALGVTDIQVLSTHTWMSGKFPKLLGIPRLMLISEEALKFCRYLKTKKPDLLIVNTSTIPGPVFAGNREKIPTAVFVHEGIRSNKKLTSLLPKAWIISLLKNKADLIFVPSKFVGREIGGEYIVSPPGIAQPTKNSEKLTQLHLRGPHIPLKIVMLGRISHEKGHLDAIHAVDLARQQGHTVELAMYGDVDPRISGTLENKLAKNRASEYIKVFPAQQDIDAIFETADLTLVLSRYETYGRVAAESLARSVPVIGLDIPVTREMLEGGGGLLVSDPVQGTAKAIAELFNNPEGYRQLVKSCSESSRSAQKAQSREHIIDLLSALTQKIKEANSLL